GSLDMKLIKHKDLKIESGAVVRVKANKRNVFYGYVFTVERSEDDDVQVTAYDQIRYLLSNDTYVFSNATATQIIRKIAQDFGLKVGSLADTGYRIPTLVEDNQKLLDIIYKALDLTLISTGNIFVLYADFGSVPLHTAHNQTGSAACRHSARAA